MCDRFCDLFSQQKWGGGPGGSADLVWGAHLPSWALTPLLLDGEPRAAGMAEKIVRTPRRKCWRCEPSPWRVLAPVWARRGLQKAWFWVGSGLVLHFGASGAALRLVAIALIHSIQACNLLILIKTFEFELIINF